MKKLLLSLSLLAAATVAAHAQNSPGISFGVKAGASLTGFSGKNTDDAKYLFGFHAGVLGNFAVSDVFSIQPEVLYSMKGAKSADQTATSGGTTYTESGNVRLHYIDVPVLAHINAGGLFFELGPQVGFLLTARAHYELSAGSSGTQSQDQTVTDQLNKVDFGYVGGLGYQLANGPGIGLRYNGGFTDIQKNNSGGDAVHNSAFQLYLTYLFGGK